MENFNISHKNTPNTGLKLASLSLAVMLIAGCGSADDPDDGSPISTTAVSGAAIDGYLAGATVYADLNEDGRKNAGEPSALTDSDGYFTTSKDGDDYCASSATKQYCLRIKGSVPDEVVIRARGGFDVFTNEPFTGEVSAKVSPLPDGSIPEQTISPVTSVLADADDTTTTSLLATLGLTSGQLEGDFLDPLSFDAKVANRAYLLHKIAVIFADTFENAYEYFGEESFFPDSATVLIYEALADSLGDESDLSNLNQAFLEEVFDAVDQEIVSTYNEEKDEDDGSIGSSLNGSGERDTAVANALSIIGLVNTAIPDTGLTSDQVRARMMGVDMVVSKMTSGASDIAEALQEALDTSEAAGTIYAALGDGSDIDFRALLGIDYTQPTIDYSQVNVTGGITFDNLADKELYIEYDDGDANVDGAALLLFAASGEQTSRGDFKLCISYRDDSGEDTDLNTEGALFDVGEWNVISDRALVLRVLGNFNFSVTSKGELNGENLLNFSYSGDSETWATDSDLADLSSNSQDMDTNADCKARLTELSGT